jgi:hypothetical protein
MMIDYNYPVFTVPIPATLGWKDKSGLESLISDTNCLLELAARHRCEDPFTGRRVALGVLKQFAEPAGALEARGWSAERIKQRLEPSAAGVCHIIFHAKVPGVAARLRRRF